MAAEGASRSERRTKRRIRRRIPCEITTADRRFTGIVLDASPDGLFVQTSAALPGGALVHLRIPETAQSPAMELDARVARAKRVPAQLVAAAAGGVGLKILRAPPELALLFRNAAEAPARPVAPVPEAPPAPALPRFRALLRQSGGNRSRTILVSAESADAARERARREAGRGWDVLEVEPAR